MYLQFLLYSKVTQPPTHTRFFCFVLFSISFFFLCFCFFRATPKALGGFQARGPNGAAATGLHHNHSNAGSEPHL